MAVFVLWKYCGKDACALRTVLHVSIVGPQFGSVPGPTSSNSGSSFPSKIQKREKKRQKKTQKKEKKYYFW
tara:strand:- start:63 stop:275 length:213 start_codon:yes stop_codon:yes gene_type:complete